MIIIDLVLVLVLGLGCLVLVLGLEGQVLVNITGGIPMYGPNGLGKGDEHPAYAPLEH